MSINPPNNIVAQHKMCQNVQKLTVNRNEQLNFCILFQVPINLTICKCLDTLLAQFSLGVNLHWNKNVSWFCPYFPTEYAGVGRNAWNTLFLLTFLCFWMEISRGKKKCFKNVSFFPLTCTYTHVHCIPQLNMQVFGEMLGTRSCFCAGSVFLDGKYHILQ